MKVLVFILIPITAVFCGCALLKAPAPRSTKMDYYQSVYDPKIGWKEEDIILEKGAPSKVYQTGEIKVLVYHVTHSIKSSGFSYKGASRGNDSESYDEVQLFFKNGVLIDWKADWSS